MRQTIMTPDEYREAFETFTASLDQQTRDAVNQLMLHTRTRLDDPQMVGVCLTAVATAKIAEIQSEVLEAQRKTAQELESMKNDPQFIESVKRIAAFKRSAEAIEKTLRHSLRAVGIFASCLALIWALTMLLTWDAAYARGGADRGGATHQTVCNDLNSYIADVSAYWRKKLGMPEAADKLGSTYERNCPR
jgi:hypothetical protein